MVQVHRQKIRLDIGRLNPEAAIKALRSQLDGKEVCQSTLFRSWFLMTGYNPGHTFGQKRKSLKISIPSSQCRFTISLL